MAFHSIRFPLDVALGARGGPERRTDVVTLAGGGEQRNGRWHYSRRRYNAGYGVKSRADMAAVLAFFEERRGRLHGFLWRDGLDFSSAGTMPGPLDQAIGTFLENERSPSRKVNELDTRGSHFYLALYWAQALAGQSQNGGLRAHFAKVARELAANEARIVAELNAAQGHPVDIGGYYRPDQDKVNQAMRPSATFNAIVDA